MQRVAYKITMGYVPKSGSRALPFKLAFNAQAVQTISDDMFLEQALAELEYIQSVFIDNADNGQKLTLQFVGSVSQRIVAKANTQGFYPVFLPNGKLIYTATTTGNVDVNVIFSNVFVNTIVWPTV
jgi:hypothetical protein